jgi:AraC-like DNA-binding protein/quercetin dioxygenase-like cupin family protein
MLLAKPYDHRLDASRPFWMTVEGWPKETPLEVHVHRGLELGVVLAGCEEIRFGELVLELRRGDCWLASMWEPHAWRAREGPTEYVVIVFLPDAVEQTGIDSQLWLSMCTAPAAKRPRTVGEEMRAAVLAIAEDMAREFSEQALEWETSVRLDLLRLLILLRRHWAREQRAGRGRALHSNALARIMPAIKMAHDHPGAAPDAALAAAACDLSPSRFHFVFRQTMGISYGRFCRRARLAYAAHQLLATDLTIEDIGQQTGFVDGSHLHHQFVKQYGCKPAEYRRRHRDLAHASASVRFTTNVGGGALGKRL